MSATAHEGDFKELLSQDQWMEGAKRQFSIPYKEELSSLSTGGTECAISGE